MLAKNSFVGESSPKSNRIARFWGDDVIKFQQIASFSKLIALKGRVAIFAFLLALGVGGNAWGQTTLISPTGDGGFETSGTSVALNNWTVVSTGADSWRIGTVPVQTAGSRFITCRQA